MDYIKSLMSYSHGCEYSGALALGFPPHKINYSRFFHCPGLFVHKRSFKNMCGIVAKEHSKKS